MKNYAALRGANTFVLSNRALLWLLGLFLSSVLTLSAQQPKVLTGHVPAATSHLVPVGRLEPDRQLHLALGLPIHNTGPLRQLVSDIYNPSSGHFHEYLTSSEFTTSFGPTPSEYDALIKFALKQGFSVTQRHDNRMLLDVAGSVAAIESAFNVHLTVYDHPTENRTFYAPDTEPSVDPAVPILDISGLDDYSVPRPLVHKSGFAPIQPLYGSGSGGTYFGKDFRAAYAPNVAVTGTGQVLGLLEFDGYYASDITSYESQAGLPNVPLTNVLLDNYNGNPGSGNIEVSLDIEMAVAMAPGLSQIVVYEAGPKGLPNDILNRMASDNSAKQLSSSWSWSGGPSSTTDNIFLQMAAQGQSFFQASGDSDAYTGAIPEPCDNPYITVVGGTTLSTSGPGGGWTSETTWNWASSGGGTNGSSGGISTSYSIPAWQQSISMAANQGSTTMRNIPDVALTADSIWVTYNNGSAGAVGGTSAATPLWAAFTALINQQALSNGKPVVGFLNPALYPLAGGAAFHDITTGNNTNSASSAKFFAVAGFDLCTGLGSPAGSGLINALAGAPTPLIVSNSLALLIESCTNNAVDPGETVTMSFGLINTGSGPTANLVATLQTGPGVSSPSAPQSYGALSPGGAAAARPFTFIASGSCGGIVTATLQLQDGSANLGTVSFTIRLGAITPITRFSESFDTVLAPGLPTGWSTAVTSGLLSNWSTTNGFSDTAPNSVYAADSGSSGQTELVSPSISIASSSAQLTFRQNYNLAFRSVSHPRSTTYYDGGVLQISIGGGAFTDIITAGGSFSSGGYNATLATGTLNPLGGSQAWSGTSTGWVTTSVVLPAAAAGQSIQLKWALGTGVNTSVGTGWFVDSVSIQDNGFSCCSPTADVSVSQSAAPNPAGVGQNMVYTLTVSNAGPSLASSLAVTDSLPSNVAFITASPGYINQGNSIAFLIGSLGAGTVSNVVITLQPTASGTLTNSAIVTATPTDPNLANNYSISSVPVYLPPAISTQPTNQTTNAGGTANFSVTATGTAPLSFQWYFGATLLSGATTPTLALSGVQASQAGSYTVVVANSVGSVTSAVATLTVTVPPAITVQPTNTTLAVGANTIFQVAGSGSSPLSFQWMFNGAALAGGTSSTLVLNNVQTNQAGNYCVVITNSAGAVTSVLAALTVLTPPSVTTQPSDQTVVLGSNATFQASVAGSSPISYQWWFGAASLSGQTSGSLNLTNVQAGQAGNYQLVANNSVGSVTSAVARLTVLVPPAINAQPTNQSVAVGTTASFQVNATGSAPLAYQWWFNATNSTGSNTNDLVLGNAQLSQAGQYTVVVTNSAGAVTSLVATLTVGTPPGIQQQPASLTLVQGQNGSISVGANGDAPLAYQWRLNSTALAGATISAYSVLNASSASAGGYDVIINNSFGSTTSSVAQLTVLIPPSISNQPTNQTALVGSNVSFAVSASGTAPMAYQWWFNSTNAAGQDTNVLSIRNVQPTQAGNYSVVISNSAGSVTSAVATLTVGVPATIVQNPSNMMVLQGQSVPLSVQASGTDPLSYQWRLNGAALPSATGAALTVASASLSDAGNYDVVVSNLYSSVTSSIAQVTVLVPPSISTQPTNQLVALGGTVTFSAAAAGTSPLNYQWFSGTNAIGGNTNFLTLASVQTNMAGGYALVVTNPAGSVTSVVAQLTVLSPPSFIQQPASLTVLAGGSADFSAAVAGSAPLAYQWTFNGSTLAGATTNSIHLTSVQPGQAGSYVLQVTNPAGSASSATAVLRVLVAPSITNPAPSSSGFSLSLQSISGLNYTLEYKNALTDPSWIPAATSLPGTGGILMFQDTNSPVASRFYRVLCQ